jgi:hypothetical protein
MTSYAASPLSLRPSSEHATPLLVSTFSSTTARTRPVSCNPTCCISIRPPHTRPQHSANLLVTVPGVTHSIDSIPTSSVDASWAGLLLQDGFAEMCSPILSTQKVYGAELCAIRPFQVPCCPVHMSTREEAPQTGCVLLVGCFVIAPNRQAPCTLCCSNLVLAMAALLRARDARISGSHIHGQGQRHLLLTRMARWLQPSFAGVPTPGHAVCAAQYISGAQICPHVVTPCSAGLSGWLHAHTTCYSRSCVWIYLLFTTCVLDLICVVVVLTYSVSSLSCAVGVAMFVYLTVDV